jgi:hypothetical protein
MTPEKDFYSISEISKFSGIHYSTIYKRILTSGFEKRFFDNDRGYKRERFFTLQEAKHLIDGLPVIQPIPEVIYVVRTTEIYESKLNYTTLNQL